jgi:hypothetical protein
MMERQLRVTLDLKILISELTREKIRQNPMWNEENQEALWQGAKMENRLLLALLQDEATLDEYLIYITRDDLAMLLESNQDTNPSVAIEDEIIERVYSKMESEDAQYFREAKENGFLYENLMLFETAFELDWKSAEIKDVRVMKEGQVDEEEIEGRRGDGQGSDNLR